MCSHLLNKCPHLQFCYLTNRLCICQPNVIACDKKKEWDPQMLAFKILCFFRKTVPVLARMGSQSVYQASLFNIRDAD